MFRRNDPLVSLEIMGEMGFVYHMPLNAGLGMELERYERVRK